MNQPTKTKSTRKPAHKSNASTRAGLHGVEDLDPRVTVVKEVATKGSDLAVWLIKLGVVLGLGYWGYKSFTNRFISLKPNSKYPKSNISEAEASTRANAIASSLAFFDYTGNEFETASQAISGLNYNGFIALYNAFGQQSGHLFAGKLNLIEWINDQFTATQIQQLSFLLGGAFFKTTAQTTINPMRDEQASFVQLFTPKKADANLVNLFVENNPAVLEAGTFCKN